MSHACAALHPLVLRVAEGEATPSEALRVAAHLPECTSCHILLARERRLHDLLDGIADPLLVSEEFLDEVMRSVPAEPPDSPGRRLRFRVVAGVGSVVVASALLSAAAQGGRPIPSSGSLGIPSGSLERLGDFLAELPGVVLALLVRCADGVALSLPTLPTPHLAVAIGAPIVAGLALLGSSLALLAARTIYRS